MDAIPALGNLFVVNATNPNLGQPGYVKDADAVVGGGQVDVNLTIKGSGNSCAGKDLGSIVIRTTGKELLAEAVTSDAESTVARQISLNEGFAGDVTITLQDAAGNTATAKWTAKVETAALPTLAITAPVAGNINVYADKGGDRTTFAQVPATVTLAAAAPSGSSVYLCTNLATATGDACPGAGTGFVKIAGTLQAASGTSVVIPVAKLFQGKQLLVAALESLSTAFSPPVLVNVDTVPPRVVSLLSVADSNADDILSVNEWPIGVSTNILATIDGVDNGLTATLTDAASGISIPAVVFGGKATFVLPNILPDGTYSFVVTVQDAAGNPNVDTSTTPPILNIEAQFPLTVKRQLPSITKTSPAFAICNIGNDVMPSSGTTCELDFVVTVNPAEAQKVEFSIEPSTAGIIGGATVTTFPAGLAGARYSLNQSVTAVTLKAVVTDKGGNTAFVTHVITLVDTVAPVVVITAPTTGSTILTQTIPFSAQTDAEVGTQIKVTTSLDNSQVGAFDVVAGTPMNVTPAGSQVVLPLGNQTLTAKVTDLAGNTSAPATVALLMDISGCDLQLTSPSSTEMIFNIANSNPTGTPLKGTHIFAGKTVRCPNGTVTFTKTVGGTSSAAGTAPIDSSGNFTLPLSFDDGEGNATINVKLAKTGIAPNSGLDVAYFADFTAPKLIDAIPVTGNLVVVEPGNPHLVAAEPGYIADADIAAAGGQVDVNLTVTGIGTVSSGGYGSAMTGSATVKNGTTDVLTPTTVTNNGNQTISGRMSLAEGFSGPVTITLTDSAGNSTTAQWAARISTIALPVVTLRAPVSGTVNALNELGGDRATFAKIPALVAYSSTPPPGSQVVLCSTAPFGSAPLCATSGHFEVPNSRMSASGTTQFYANVQIALGTQDIIAEVTSGSGELAKSLPSHLIVDTIPPQVMTFVANDDKSPKDGTVSGSELAPGAAATFTATFTGVEDGRTATLHEETGTPVVVTTAPVNSGSATFTVPNPSDALHKYRISVTDAAGNPNESTTPLISNPAAALTVTFQRVAPSIARVAPVTDVCNKAMDKDASSTLTCETDFTVLVGGTAARVDFSLVPSGAGTISPASVTSFPSSMATARYSLQQSTSVATLVATVYDSAGNSSQTSYPIVRVDTVSPTLAITSPANGQTEFTQTFPVTVTTDAEVGQTVTVKSVSTGSIVGTGLVVAGTPNTATFNVSLTGGSQSLSATVLDVAGNESVAATVAVVLNLAGCDVNFTNPSSASPVFNIANAPGGNVHITGFSTLSGCANKQINLSASIDGAAAISLGSVTTDGSMQFAFDYKFIDGSVTVFSGLSTVAGSTPKSFTAITDVTAPSVQVLAPVPNLSNQLFVVAKDGNLNIKNAVAGFVADLDNATAGGQVLFSISETGAGPSANQGTGTLTITQGAALKYSQTFATNAVQALTPTVTLDQAVVGPLTITVTDHAGNSASATMQSTVDVVAPGIPSFVTTDPGNGQYTRVTNERHADVELYFMTPSDDGPTGQTLSWDFGYTNSTTLAAGSFDDITFDNATITTKVTIPTVAGLGVANHVSLARLPPLNTFYFAPRLVDGVGNRAAMSAYPLPILWRSVSIAFPLTGSTSAGFGSQIATGGDVNGDGKPDFVIGAPTALNGTLTNAGSVTLLLGGTAPPTISQTLQGDAVSQQLGGFMALVDLNKDGRADLLTYASGKIRAYLAQPTPPYFAATPSFTFSGPTSMSSIASCPRLLRRRLRRVGIGLPGSQLQRRRCLPICRAFRTGLL